MDYLRPFLKGLSHALLLRLVQPSFAPERFPFRFRYPLYGLLEFLSHRAGDGCGDEAESGVFPLPAVGEKVRLVPGVVAPKGNITAGSAGSSA